MKSSKKTKKKNTRKPEQTFEERWGNWEREARQRSAWGQYSQTMYLINEQEDDYKLAHGTDSQKEEITKRRKNRSPRMFIG